MALRKATRQQVKLKIGMFGPSGSGKTMSSLLLASGITTRDKIALIDTENGSADLYAHLGAYSVLPLKAPFSPERYIKAIDECIEAGMEVIVIDSISHEREGKGGILEELNAMTGNSFTNRAKMTPRHNQLIQKILQTPLHIIVTGRRKQEYEMVKGTDGKIKVEKVGMAIVQRDGLDYELSLVFEIDINNNASVSKDRTEIFRGLPEFKITSEEGIKLMDWANKGIEELVIAETVDSNSIFDSLNRQAGSEDIKENTEKTRRILQDTPVAEMDMKAGIIKGQVSEAPIFNEKQREAMINFIDLAVTCLKNGGVN